MVFAYGEYSSPCRRLAGGRRSAAGMRTPFVLKHKQGTMSHDVLPNKKPPIWVAFKMKKDCRGSLFYKK